MGCHGLHDENSGRVPSPHLSEGFGEDSTSRWGRGMSVAPVEETLEAAGMWTIQDYIRRLQDNIEYYIVTRLIYDMFSEVEGLQGRGVAG